MNEQEWLTALNPSIMLDFFVKSKTQVDLIDPSVNDRKLRLFAAGCCRQVWDLLTNNLSRTAIMMSERFADGEITWDELRHACIYGGEDIIHSVTTLYAQSVIHAANHTAHYVGLKVGIPKVVNLIHCVFSNPFRPVRCRWCAGDGLASHEDDEKACLVCGGTGGLPKKWLTDEVVGLAEAAYELRLENGQLDQGRLNVLADALEEVGCQGERVWLCNNQGNHSHHGKIGQVIHGELHEEDPHKLHHHHDNKCPREDKLHPIVDHLRLSGLHVRGCWALDMVLEMMKIDKRV